MNIKEAAALMNEKGRLGILKVSAQQKARYSMGNENPLYRQENHITPSYNIRVEFTNKDRRLVEDVSNAFGWGKVVPVQKGRYWTYMAWGKNGAKVLQTIAPHLSPARKKVANLLLKLDAIHTENVHHKGTNGRRGKPAVSEATVAQMEAIYVAVKDINALQRASK